MRVARGGDARTLTQEVTILLLDCVTTLMPKSFLTWSTWSTKVTKVTKAAKVTNVSSRSGRIRLAVRARPGICCTSF